jgi:vancomycin resistance protein YoaR
MTSVPSSRHEYRQSDVSPWLIRIPILAISGVILLALILVMLVGFFQLRYHDKIVPGVSALGLNLSGMSADDARAALDNAFTYDQDAVFTFRDGDQFWQIPAGDLGIAFDVNTTVGQARAAGHSGNVLIDTMDQALIWLNGYTVSPIVRYDQNVAVQRLSAVANEINHPPVDAMLTLNGTTVTATPSQVGRTVDILATLRHLDDTVLSLGTGAEVPLVITETQPNIRDAQAAADKAQIALSTPLTLAAEDTNGAALGPWTATVEQIGQLLKPILVDNGDGTFSYDVDLDMNVFSGFLQTLAPGLITTPQDARFTFSEDSHQLEVIQPSVSGRSLNIPQTLDRMQQAVFHPGNRSVMMAFDYTLPQYHEGITAAELGITELVSEATTYYSGSSQPRRDNIAQAAGRFNGVIVGPGEVFSFNSIVGDISPETGFVSGKVIIGGRTVDGVGGGVCQVSTTAFQAAFYAGFPILERYAHGYRVGYYEAGEGVGMDAAIYNPDLDFRFQNDTPYSLLIETSVFPSRNAVQFRFYSTNPGRRVTRDQAVVSNQQAAAPTRYEPNPDLQPGQSLQVDWAAAGADVSVTRHILDLTGNEIGEDTFVSHYQPWGAIIQVAPSALPQ